MVNPFLQIYLTTLGKNYPEKNSTHEEKKINFPYTQLTPELSTASARINKYYISLVHTIDQIPWNECP